MEKINKIKTELEKLSFNESFRRLRQEIIEQQDKGYLTDDDDISGVELWNKIVERVQACNSFKEMTDDPFFSRLVTGRYELLYTNIKNEPIDINDPLYDTSNPDFAQEIVSTLYQVFYSGQRYKIDTESFIKRIIELIPQSTDMLDVVSEELAHDAKNAFGPYSEKVRRAYEQAIK